MGGCAQGVLNLQPVPVLPPVPPHGGAGQAHPQAALQIQEVPAGPQDRHGRPAPGTDTDYTQLHALV